jgi:pimeloyl-ACP methyl ester carboxylesterase
MHGDADRVRSVLDGIDGPIVLVGHSYGGAVITDAGDHPAVRELVFLCALVLDEGEDAGSVFAGAPMPEPIEASELAAGMRFDETGTVATIDPAAAHACLYQDCEPADVEWASARLSPQPMATMQQPPRGVAWRSRPSTYVVAAEDRAIPPALQRWLATRCTVSVEWPTGHSPFLSDPDLVVGLLTQVASR